jgi:deazaflavin-dependent oxidoreductase (nitroreductase family)
LNQTEKDFTKLGSFDRFVNGAIGKLVSLGIGPSHMHVLEVRGRKSGATYSLPVDRLDLDGRHYLVAPRGRTQWVKNAEAQQQVTLRRGSRVVRYRLRTLSNEEKPAIIKAYLDAFRKEVQRYFPLPAGSPVEDFVPLIDRYPAFELSPGP